MIVEHRHSGIPLRSDRVCAYLVLATLLAISTAATPAGEVAAEMVPRSEWREGLERGLTAAIGEFRAGVPEKMKEGHIRGMAIALVDDQGVVWAEGFGFADLKKRFPVTPNTPFLIGGISQMITAVAVLKAVEDGILDLDVPIKSYVSEFNVHSRYEEDPERRITLRRLLSHTSGLPMAAPLGNFFEPSPGIPFDDYVESLFGVWLTCPAGQGLVYSRPNFDLAGYVLQTVMKQPIDQHFAERVFGPLGMTNTSVNRQEILLRRDRAEGNELFTDELPAVNPFLASGGAYSSATDIARLVELHLRRGTVEGKRFLEESTVALMQTPAARLGTPEQYSFMGLGTTIEKRYPEFTELILYSEGWGFGFTSFVHWYPEYGIGVVCLSNQGSNAAFSQLALGLSDRLVKEGILEKRYPQQHPGGEGSIPIWTASPDHHPTAYREEWNKYCGLYPLRVDYKLKWWAKLAVLILGKEEWTPRVKVHDQDGFLCVTESEFFAKLGGFWPRHVEERLAEIQPGLFITAKGWGLDFRGKTPTWGNYRLKD